MSTDPRQTAQLGRDLVVTQLRNRGFVVREVSIGRRPVLLVERAGVRRQVRVSAKRRGTWQTATAYGAKVAPPELHGRIWVFVDVGRREPEFFVVPEDWMVEDIYARYQRYLDKHGGTRKHSRSSNHHAVTLHHLEGWRDRWDLLETEGDAR